MSPILPAEAHHLAAQLLVKRYDDFHAKEQAVLLMIDVLYSNGYGDMLEVIGKALKVGGLSP